MSANSWSVRCHMRCAVSKPRVADGGMSLAFGPTSGWGAVSSCMRQLSKYKRVANERVRSARQDRCCDVPFRGFFELGVGPITRPIGKSPTHPYGVSPSSLRGQQNEKPLVSRIFPIHSQRGERNADPKNSPSRKTIGPHRKSAGVKEAHRHSSFVSCWGLPSDAPDFFFLLGRPKRIRWTRRFSFLVFVKQRKKIVCGMGIFVL